MIRITRKHGLGLWMLISLLYYGAGQREGFISIDCGASVNSTDPDTGIVWTTDAPYISTGINEIVTSVPSRALNERQLKTLRYFPANRSKHCYTLPASRNSSYLLRTTVFHGGFQPKVDNEFDISVDSVVVESIGLTASDENVVGVFEYVVAATSNRVNFCLLPRTGVAFVSTLELRPLEVGMYDVVFQGLYLKALTRLNCGAQPTDPPVRYPDDLYDRIWASPGENFRITTTATTSEVPVPDYNFDKPPPLVMQTAWVNSASFWWFVPISDYELEKTSTYYLNHFLAEIQNIEPTDTRIIDIILNGKSYLDNLTINSETNQIFLRSQTLTSTGANFTFSASPESDLGPLLNAAEIYASRAAVKSSTDERDVDALEVVKNSFGLSSWTGDPCLPVAYNWLTCDEGTTPRVTKIHLSKFNLVGTIPASIAELTALTELLLDNNQIRGGIPDLSKLTKLKTLLLQNNSLSGGIPSTLASLPVLTELVLSNNKLSGPIPAALTNRNGLNVETSGNVNLCAPTEDCPVLPVDLSDDNGGGGGGGGGGSGALIGGIAGGVVVVLAIVGLLVWLYCRKRPKPTPALASISVDNRNQSDAFKGLKGSTKGSNASSSRSVGGAAAVKQARAFTLAEVQEATKGYKSKIGEGGFGPVYYGILPDGTELAVKVNSDNSGQGTREFFNEVSLLSRVHHKNLVSLLGYCEEDGQQILIYEYMAKGTLREHLYGKDMKGRTSWKDRLEIALNAAKGLEYLHNDCIPKIIHRDIKSNNILLNEKLLAKVADFGISKLAPEADETTGVSTIVRGTTGYLDPEYYAHNKLSQKSDVYSFGVVLLEIICGRPPNSSVYPDAKQYNLVEWARGQLNGSDLESIVDQAIRGTFNVMSMWKVAELAMGCVEPYGVNRPDMKLVVRGLTEASEVEVAKPQQYGPPDGTAFGVSTTFHTESSYPSTQSSVTFVPEYPGANPSAPPLLFTPPATFVRIPSDTRDSDSSWLAPKPR